MTNTLLFCTGESGSGKSYFIKNILPTGGKKFHNLKSATTRPMREGEADGREYYFRDEAYFDTEKFATKLFVNEQFWKPGQPKWLYGVPEFEILDNLGTNFTYDVIQPRYIRQMIDWFKENKLDYNFKIAWFSPIANSKNIIKGRQNMPDDIKVRTANTCNSEDFAKAGLIPDFFIQVQPPHDCFLTVRGDDRILPSLSMEVLLMEYYQRQKDN